MKIARIICCQLDSTLRPTMKRGFEIIPAQPDLILQGSCQNSSTAYCDCYSYEYFKNVGVLP
ncbi:hypothetical protein QUB37_14380 [Microcoleus sp. AT3-A2]